MLARAVSELPVGPFLYEPKWDGVRCLATVRHGGVELTSRSGKPLGQGFPEVVAGLSRLAVDSATLDGELLVSNDGEFDFGKVLSRVSSRTPDPSTQALLMVFDLIEIDGIEVGDLPLSSRRRALETLVGRDLPGVCVSPATTDPETADRWFESYVGPGIDGVIAKNLDSPYTPGRRTMLKRKRELTLDCVVAGARPSAGGGYSSLLLGLFDDEGELVYIGAASGFSSQDETELAGRLAPLEIARSDHPWSALEERSNWTPLEPTQVCEVASTHYEQGRLRSPARFVRWRADRDPASCRTDQLNLAKAPSRP